MTTDPNDLASYALGLLEPERMSEIEHHLQSHPEEVREVEGYLANLAQMVLELEPEKVSNVASLKAETRLLERIRQGKNQANSHTNAILHIVPDPKEPVQEDSARGLTQQYSKRISWLWPSGLGAAAVLAVLYFGGWQQIQNWQQTQLEHSYIAQPGSISKPLLGAKGDSRGILVKLANNQVFVSLELAPNSSKVYQLWEIRDKKIFSLGIFQGKTFMGSRDVQTGSVVGVTLEPPGGSDQPTQAPLALVQL